MKTWKPWTLALAAVLVALVAFLWRQHNPLEHTYRQYVSARIEETIALLETDPTAFRSETRDAVRLVAAAAAQHLIVSPESWYILAIQYEREGDYYEAEMVLRETIEMAGAWSWPYVALGVLLARYEQERIDEAEHLLRIAIELQPDWVRPYNSLGVVLRLLGRLDEAEEMALTALELAPYDVAAHNNYANLLVVQQRYEEAETHYMFAMESEPENAKPPYNLACLYSITGAFEKACDFLKMAITLNDEVYMDAAVDPYFDPLREHACFRALIYGDMPVPEGETDNDSEAPEPEE